MATTERLLAKKLNPDRDTLVPALLVFVSAGVRRTVLCETAGLHFPPRSGPLRSTAYGPSPWTAEPTPDQAREMERLFILTLFL